MHLHPVQDKAEIARVFPVSAITEQGIRDAVSAGNDPISLFDYHLS